MLMPAIAVPSRNQAPSITPASPFRTALPLHRGEEQAEQTLTPQGVEIRAGGGGGGWCWSGCCEPLGYTHPPSRRSIALRRGWRRGLLVAVGLRRRLLLLVAWGGKDGSVSWCWDMRDTAKPLAKKSRLPSQQTQGHAAGQAATPAAPPALPGLLGWM